MRPFRAYFETEAASGVVFLATLLALGWANWLPHGLDLFFETPFELRFGSDSLSSPLSALDQRSAHRHLFVAGMEIKRELAVGELRTFD